MDFEDHLLDCFSQLSVGGLFPQAVIQTSFPMPLHETLKRLHALDKTSSLFHWHLNSFLRSDEYQLLSPSGLQKEDLASLVQYLDSVSLQVTLLFAVPNTAVGSCQHFRSRSPDIPSMLARTEENMWYDEDNAKFMYGFKLSSGCWPSIRFGEGARRNIWRVEGAGSTHTVVSREILAKT